MRGRREPWSPHPAAATHRLPVKQQLQRGNGIRGRLPRARAGPSQQVLPFQGQRDGLFLDQRGSRPAQVGDGLGDRRTVHRAAPPPATSARPLSPPWYLQEPGVETHVLETQRLRVRHAAALRGQRTHTTRKTQRRVGRHHQSASRAPPPPGSAGAWASGVPAGLCGCGGARGVRRWCCRWPPQPLVHRGCSRLPPQSALSLAASP